MWWLTPVILVFWRLRQEKSEVGGQPVIHNEALSRKSKQHQKVTAVGTNTSIIYTVANGLIVIVTR